MMRSNIRSRQLGAKLSPNASVHCTPCCSVVATSPHPSPATLRYSSPGPHHSLRARGRAPRRLCLGIFGQGCYERRRWRARALCQSQLVRQTSQEMVLESAKYVVPEKGAASVEEADLGQIPVPEWCWEQPLWGAMSQTHPLLRCQVMVGQAMAYERGVCMSSGWGALRPPVQTFLPRP